MPFFYFQVYLICQAVGIALETRRLDIFEQAILKSVSNFSFYLAVFSISPVLSCFWSDLNISFFITDEACSAVRDNGLKLFFTQYYLI